MASAKKNYIYNSCYTVLNMLLPLVTAPYLARIIGKEGVGTYAFCFSIAQYFVLIAKLGLVNYGTREIAKCRRDKNALSSIFVNLFCLQCLATCIITIAYFFYAIFWAGDLQKYALIFFIWVAGSLLDIDWFWFGLEEFKKVTIRNVIVKIITVICIFVLVKTKSDVWLYALIIVIGNVIGYISIWIGLRKRVKIAKAKWSEMKNHIAPCLIMLIPVLALNIYRSMDKVMLGAISSMAETGLYDNGEKLVYCLSGLISSFGTIMLPKMSNLAQENQQEKIKYYISKSFKLIAILTSIMTFGLISISDNIILLLFGKEFQKSSLILTMTAPTLLFMGFGNVVRTQYIIPYKKDEIYVKSILFGSIINLVANILLIPHFASIGAVVGTLLAEAFVPFYQFMRLKNEFNFANDFVKALPYIAIGLVMCFSTKLIQYALGTSTFTLIFQIVVGGIIFIGLSFVYIRRFDLEIAGIFKQVLRNRKK